MNLKTVWRVLLILLLGAGSVGAWVWWKSTQKSPLPEGIVSGNGRVESVEVDVAAKYGGRIAEIPAKEGDLVEEGQVVARMDTSEMDAELAQNKANLAEAKATELEVTAEVAERESQWKLAEQQYLRTRSLYQRQAVSKEDYDQAEAKRGTTKAALAGTQAKLQTSKESIAVAEAQIKKTQVRIDDATLKSPVKGRVLYRLAEPGEVVSLGGKVLTLINLGDVYMEIYLPGRQAARVRMGADGRIVLDARPEYSAPAKVSYVSPEAQFTPKQVETQSERDKLMFRIKLKVPREIVLPYIERVKTGVRGMGYVRIDDAVEWPDYLNRPLPPKPPGA
jgi:HlyD family secretion protein